MLNIKSDFNPRSPYGERPIYLGSQTALQNFNPRSPYGERLRAEWQAVILSAFQSTLPLRGATQRHSIGQIADQFQSTLPLRGATLANAASILPHLISIHAPLTGSDPLRRAYKKRRNHFNPRSPYGERPYSYKRNSGAYYFNPRSPYGERQNPRRVFRMIDIFQSTLPLRGATKFKVVHAVQKNISIHAPLTGSDSQVRGVKNDQFISIHAPLTGSDKFGQIQRQFFHISIHAPLTGSDFPATVDNISCWKFQSTLPLRGATSTWIPTPPR